MRIIYEPNMGIVQATIPMEGEPYILIKSNK